MLAQRWAVWSILRTKNDEVELYIDQHCGRMGEMCHMRDMKRRSDILDKTMEIFAKESYIGLYNISEKVCSRLPTVALNIALPYLGHSDPRGAVGVPHDGLLHQLSPLLPVVCHGLSLCCGLADPLHDIFSPLLLQPARLFFARL